MKKSSLILAVLALVMQGVVSNNVWADGDDPVPFIILPPGGDDGGDVPPLTGGPGDEGGDGNGGEAKPKSPVQMPTVVQDGYTLYIISGCSGATLILRDEYETEVFKNGSDYTFEKKGNFTITKGVVVEKGAKLKIINSTANY